MFQNISDADLEQRRAELADRAKQLGGKKSLAARREKQSNAEQFNEITRELKRRKDNADR